MADRNKSRDESRGRAEKIAVFIADGMADYKLKELGNATPLEAADTPNLDMLARSGMGGLLRTIPRNFGAGSDIANLNILGYEPEKYYTGRGAIEAIALGIELADNEIAWRCNLITEKNGKIHDYSAGHITSEEARLLIDELNKAFISYGRFYAGISYRNIFVSKFGNNLISIPPHDAIGRSIEECLLRPKTGSKSEREEAEKLNELMLKSRQILEEHEVNKRRAEHGLSKANMLWLWGQGKKMKLESFYKLHNLKAFAISAVDIVKGIAKLAGIDIVSVPGATGYYDTNYEAKAKYAAKSLFEESYDFAYVHLEAIDEASHAGDVEMKIKCIENFDKKLLGKFLNEADEDCIIAVLPDHYTPIPLKTHSKERVPFIIHSKNLEKRDGIKRYSEEEIAKHGSLNINKGREFIEILKKP